MRVDVEKIRGGPQYPDGARPSISERYEFFSSFYCIVYETQSCHFRAKMASLFARMTSHFKKKFFFRDDSCKIQRYLKHI